MGYKGRRRVLDDMSGSITYWTMGNTPHTYGWNQAGLQATSSRGNPGWLAYKRTGEKGSRTNMGSEFITIKHSVNNGAYRVSGHDVRYPSPSSPYYYRVNGFFLPVAPVDESFKVSPTLYGPDASGMMVFPSFPGMDVAGATAISRCAPTNPHAGLATTLGELKHDGLPSLTSAALKGRERGTVQGVASDNLKAQFELMPLVSDINSVYTSLRDRQKILAQYARDSGRPVRRTYQFPTTTTAVTNYSNSTSRRPWPTLLGLFKSTGALTKRTTTTVQTRFVGSFVYHRAGGDTQWSRILQKYQDVNHLLGTGYGPGTAWDLMPWSWAVDWFTNVGDVMNNITMMMNDGLIMEYGYVMTTQTVTVEYLRTGLDFFSSFLLETPSPIVASTTRVSKWRRQANPFGFGISYSGLSGRQMSILASLGITRSSRVP